MKKTDTELFDFIEAETNAGSCLGIINDDDGHWAVSDEGNQNVPLKFPSDIITRFYIPKKKWKKTIREAILSYMKECENEKRKK